mmetsp:Transcript_996/g.2076  ORF Transcript_996/g.2076 Transcript_996/m.2076 type:complete len:658 (-) Transcript_996:5927-7900(-)
MGCGFFQHARLVEDPGQLLQLLLPLALVRGGPPPEKQSRLQPRVPLPRENRQLSSRFLPLLDKLQLPGGAERPLQRPVRVECGREFQLLLLQLHAVEERDPPLERRPEDALLHERDHVVPLLLRNSLPPHLAPEPAEPPPQLHPREAARQPYQRRALLPLQHEDRHPVKKSSAQHTVELPLLQGQNARCQPLAPALLPAPAVESLAQKHAAPPVAEALEVRPETLALAVGALPSAEVGAKEVPQSNLLQDVRRHGYAFLDHRELVPEVQNLHAGFGLPPQFQLLECLDLADVRGPAAERVEDAPRITPKSNLASDEAIPLPYLHFSFPCTPRPNRQPSAHGVADSFDRSCEELVSLQPPAPVEKCCLHQLPGDLLAFPPHRESAERAVRKRRERRPQAVPKQHRRRLLLRRPDFRESPPLLQDFCEFEAKQLAENVDVRQQLLPVPQQQLREAVPLRSSLERADEKLQRLVQSAVLHEAENRLLLPFFGEEKVGLDYFFAQVLLYHAPFGERAKRVLAPLPVPSQLPLRAEKPQPLHPIHDRPEGTKRELQVHEALLLHERDNRRLPLLLEYCLVAEQRERPDEEPFFPDLREAKDNLAAEKALPPSGQRFRAVGLVEMEGADVFQDAYALGERTVLLQHRKRLVQEEIVARGQKAD